MKTCQIYLLVSGHTPTILDHRLLIIVRVLRLLVEEMAQAVVDGGFALFNLTVFVSFHIFLEDVFKEGG